MQSKDIKKKILNTIPDELGTYSKSGINFPAVWIGSSVPGFDCKGLEILIPSLPDTETRKGKIITQDWTITLLKHDCDVGVFESAFNKLTNIFPNSSRYFDYGGNLPNVVDFVEIVYHCVYYNSI